MNSLNQHPILISSNKECLILLQLFTLYYIATALFCVSGLFTRAIAESGTALADWANMDTKTASQRAIRLGKNVGCDTSNMTIMVGCLSRISEAELLKASNNILTEQVSINVNVNV